MSALAVQTVSAPSENWDDDFDFHSQSGSPKRHNALHGASDTVRISMATEDWDAENPISSTSIMNHDPPRPSNVLADKLNTTAANISHWTENDPATPQKSSFPITIANAESWDDDFLDKTDSARPSPRTKNNPSRQSVGGKLRAGVATHHRKPVHPDDEEEHESWDDEFDFSQSPAKPSESSTPGKSTRLPDRRSSLVPAGNLPHDSSSDDDDLDFGVAGAEEDRTVTARSRRAPQQHTPPPPIPSMPFTLTPLSQQLSMSSNTHLSSPFPRSPTTSVFSVPTPSVADTNSLRSTAPLRPSLSRTSANNALKYLPPSPPIHRERRRLRKKSRPQHQGVIELSDLNRDYPLSDTDADYRLEEIEERGSPSPPLVTSDSTGPGIPPISPPVASSSGALLSRIGSVKRWTTRKKRGSTTPSEVGREEKGKVLKLNNADKILDTINSDGQPTPRPRASLSSLLHTSQVAPPPPPSSSWFFRPSSPIYTRGRNSIGKNSNPRSSFTGSRSESMTDLSTRGSVYDSSSNYDEDSTSQNNTNKLAKRKSLGFVQLSKGLGFNDNTSASIEKGKSKGDQELSYGSSLDIRKTTSKRPVSMQGHKLPSTVREAATQRHASYGTPKSKELSASTNDLLEITRDRKRSTSRSVRLKSRGSPNDVNKPTKAKETEQVKQEEREKDKGKGKEEGSRSFMGNIRRLSMVGRHRRNKSGASLKHMDVLAPALVELAGRPPTPEAAGQPDDPPSLPPLPSLSELRISRPHTPRTPKPSPTLLPPIELQPPSPPRNVIEEATERINRGLDTSIEALLLPPSSDSSPLPSTTSSSGSGTSPPFPLSPIQNYPDSRSPITPKPTKIPSSPPQTASLGRSTISPKHSILNPDLVQRRNSLNDLKSDLKIPARISQAQQGLKRDLGMVRDFALLIEQLKKQQEIHHDLTLQMQRKLDAQTQLAQDPAARAVSPSFLNLAKPKTRARSNTNPGNSSRHKDWVVAFDSINSKYHVSWECAELLVDLADGTSAPTSPPPSSGPSARFVAGEKRGRERAITLAGDESKPSTPTHGMSSSMIVPSTSHQYPGPPPASPPAWRASTGRQDLNQRQLVLLREMLNNTEGVLSIDGHGYPYPLTVPEESTSSLTDSLQVNKNWRWDDPMSSTVTLPSAEHPGELSSKRRRMSKFIGMTGLRDILRALKRSYSENATNRIQTSPSLPVEHNHGTVSMVSLSTDTSHDKGSASHNLPRPTTNPQQRRRAKTSAGPETVGKSGKERGRDREPKLPSPSSHGIQPFTKSSPRRPSLASIFRLGSRKNTPPSASATNLEIYDSDAVHTDPSRSTTRIGTNQHANTNSPLEEDWDRIDSDSDFRITPKTLSAKLASGGDGRDEGSTLKIQKTKSPYLQYQAPSSATQLSRPTTPRRSASGSQLSLWAESPTKSKAHAHHYAPIRAPRLSNVDEGVEGTRQREHDPRRRSSSRMSSGKIQKSGSVRSVPSKQAYTESRLAMTPGNIKPLLESAKEVYARLGECILEIQQLLQGDGLVERSISGSSCASASGQSSVS